MVPQGVLALSAAALVMMSGCASKERELEAVAKDWCLTIRASQVIPVYPMTEDLQVGDVFLVQQTVQNQHDAYKRRGFLALDNHIARLTPTRYDSSYDRSFFKPEEVGSVMPRSWLTPGEASSFDRAPVAAFPAYTFSVTSGQGFAAALPVQGVPVGLSLLNSDAASGSVTLKDARTYGIAMTDLLADVQGWAEKESNRTFLAAYAPETAGTTDAKTNYVRVVSRVYLVGSVNVTLNDASASSGGLSVGVPKPVEIPLLQAAKVANTTEANTATADAYGKGLASMTTALNAARNQAGEALPGATLKVVSASARTVSMDEKFTRPVVIGYLGFDMAILPGGRLGPPMPTYVVLERNVQPSSASELPAYLAAISMRDIGTYRAIDAIASSATDKDRQKAKAIRDEINAIAGSVLPKTYPVVIWNINASGAVIAQVPVDTPIDTRGGEYRAWVEYLSRLESSEALLSTLVKDGKASGDQKDSLQATRSQILRVRSVAGALGGELKRGSDLFNR
ncbi:MAG: hypothetical protein IBJ18_07085 [Phycisphaerales bacterium]|nr:hypothetical protein [Phycisphaerales bacterium]